LEVFGTIPNNAKGFRQERKHLSLDDSKSLFSKNAYRLKHGNIYLESIEDLKKFTKKSNIARRKEEKTSVISLMSAKYNGENTSVRNDKYEYIERPLVINIDVLKDRINELLDPTNKNVCLHELSVLRRILHMHENNLPLIYSSKHHGLRWTGINENLSIGLQGLKKKMRNLLFSSYYDYDIVSSAPHILYRLYVSIYTADEDRLKILENFLKNVKKYRKILADLVLKTEIKTEKEALMRSKKIITAVFFGSNPLFPKSKLKLNYELRKAIKDDVLISGLIKDIKKLFSKMESYYVTNREMIEETDKFIVKNPFGLRIIITKWTILPHQLNT
jgi:hypothetical protein